MPVNTILNQFLPELFNIIQPNEEFKKLNGDHKFTAIWYDMIVDVPRSDINNMHF